MIRLDIGMRVVVDAPHLKSHNETGKVSFSWGPHPESLIEVRLDKGNTITTKQKNLKEKVEDYQVLSKNDDASKDEQRYLALVHYHDYDENPTTLEEATTLFDEDELGQPELTVYGTKEEILERIKEDSSFGSYDHCFVILGNELYPVETNIHVNW